MARTLIEINKEIEALQKEAEAVRPKEIKEVIARMKEAIVFYSLTPEDLFGSAQRARKGPLGGASSSTARKVRGSNTSATQKVVSPAKFKDPSSDKTWTGNGKRPRWFVEALAAGKSAEELAI